MFALFSKLRESLRSIFQKPFSQDIAALGSLSFLWVFMVWTINPVGEFPLNDDWMYARSVFELVKNGKYVLCDFQAAIAFFQILWGALFSLIFGFSMTTLRLSVSVLGWLGVCASYFLFQKANQGKPISFFCSVLLATTPLYFALANTFMTNIPFLAWVIMSFLFFMNWFENERMRDLIFGICFACAAVLVRQLALAVPIAFGLAYFVKRGFSKRTILVSFGAIAAVAVTLMLYHRVIESTIGIPYMDRVKAMLLTSTLYNIKNGEGGLILFRFSMCLVIILLYLGLFLLPLLILTVPAAWHSVSKRRKIFQCIVGGGFTLLAIYIMLRSEKIMPLLGVYIYDLGIGPRTLQGLSTLYKGLPLLWLTVSELSVLGGVLLVMQISDALAQIVKDAFVERNISKHGVSLFCLSAIFIHYIPFGFSGHFDLYLSFYIPFLIFFLLVRASKKRPQKRMVFISGMLLVFLGWFSIAGTHDYLSANRTRWLGLNYLMKIKNISPREIDGGYEFNGWYLYDPQYKKIPGRKWWWVDDDKYVAAYGPLEGYEVMEVLPYKLWLPPGIGNIYFLKRIKETVERDFSQARDVYTLG